MLFLETIEIGRIHTNYRNARLGARYLDSTLKRFNYAESEYDVIFCK